MDPLRFAAPVARKLPDPQGWEYIRVGTSRVHGRGLFAARDLPKGTRIMQYLGERVDKKEGNRRTDEQWERGRVYTFELSRRVDLDGDVPGNLARLANFSCEPNAESFNESGRRIWIQAMRDIRKGEEITYDYCFPLIEPPPVCRCGAKTCRGYIVGEDHVQDLKRWLKRQEEGGDAGKGRSSRAGQRKETAAAAKGRKSRKRNRKRTRTVRGPARGKAGPKRRPT